MKFGNQIDTPKENPPFKTYPARLVGIYDVGLQPGFNEGDPVKPQVILVYDLLGKEKKSDGSVFQVAEFLTVSLHEKATLVKRLVSLGAPAKQKKGEEWFDLPDDFAMQSLLDAPCMVTVKANQKGNAKIDTVIPPIDGIAIPDSISDLGFLDLDSDDDITQFDAAPKWIQERARPNIKE